MSDTKITIHQLNSFYDKFNNSAARANGIRFGQAWINQFLPADQADPEVFYETNDAVAYRLICEKYVDPKSYDQFT